MRSEILYKTASKTQFVKKMDLRSFATLADDVIFRVAHVKIGTSKLTWVPN